ncbi:MAG: radical SAM protein [Clostridia bacterium]
MKIGLHDAERDTMKNKTFPNLAIMKISAYHKSIGDTVEWFEPFEASSYDKVYSSSVFDFTDKPKNLYLPNNTIYGGTGYGLYGKENDLPCEVDSMYPDYSMYPNCDYAIGFLTRGCINNCSFCVVPKKEGKIRAYARWSDIVRLDTPRLHLMDNNILACEHGVEQLRQLSHTGYKIDLNQGMDIMLLNDEIAKIIKDIKWDSYIRFSCDKEYQLPYFENMLQLFEKYKIPKSKVFIYLLVQKDIDNAERRLQTLHKMCKSFNIYAQAERNSLLGIEPNKEQLEFANRYVYSRNYKQETWTEHKRRCYEKHSAI